jgi:hypothetical protein
MPSPIPACGPAIRLRMTDQADVKMLIHWSLPAFKRHRYDCIVTLGPDIEVRLFTVLIASALLGDTPTGAAEGDLDFL